LSELTEVLTKDGSYSLRSVFLRENFHSLLGALEETKSKFTATSNLQRFKGKSLSVLDICFGLGYNSASLLDELIKQKSYLNLYALEIIKSLLNIHLEMNLSLNYGLQKSKKYLNHCIKKLTLRINFLNAVFCGVMLEKKSKLFLQLLNSI